MAMLNIFGHFFIVAALFFCLVAGDTCRFCYYRENIVHKFLYQVKSCADSSGCSATESQEHVALAYPQDSKVKPCINDKCTDVCVLPGGSCEKDGDCCNFPTIPKYYLKGVYSLYPDVIVKLSKSTGAACFLGTCRLDSYKNGTTGVSPQKCYIQDPTVTDSYLVYSLDTCKSCRVATGKRDDEHLGVKMGAKTKDGVVLRNVNKTCAYCSVINGPCATASDCCNNYYSYAERAIQEKYLEGGYALKIDKVKCMDGKCAINACFDEKEKCVAGSAKKCCLATHVCPPNAVYTSCTDKSKVPTPDCSKKTGLVSCRGYGGIERFCACTFPTPQVCLANGGCKTCSLVGESCKGNDECCYTNNACLGGKCKRCVTVASGLTCDTLPCCTGSCKLITAAEGYFKRCK